MTTSTVPTMPVPRALESLVGLVHHPEADVPEVPVRDVLAALAAAVGCQVAGYVNAALRDTPPGTVERIDVIHWLGRSAQMLDDLSDAWNAAYPPPTVPSSEI